MVFKARDPLVAFFPLAIIWLLDLWTAQYAVLLILTPFLITMLLSRYELHVHEEELQFKFKLLNFSIWTRRVEPRNIKKIEFKRGGWSTKQVIVRIQNRLRWKIIRFQPEDFTIALRDFAERHSIPVRIHRDFEYL